VIDGNASAARLRLAAPISNRYHWGKERIMIEFTQEQWQAITQEETPMGIEPQSQMAYIVVRKEEYDKLQMGSRDEAEAAHVLRIAWMRRMGLAENEIAESLRDDPPSCLQDELRQMKALENLDRITPSSDVLRKFAIRY
jgi:hypothetical protein